jgi:hypothetical protein
MRSRWSYGTIALASLALAGCDARPGAATQAQAPGAPEAATTQTTVPAGAAGTGVAACTDGLTIRLVGVNPSGVDAGLVLRMSSLLGSFLDDQGNSIVVYPKNPATWPLDVTTDAVTHDLGTLMIPMDRTLTSGFIQVVFSGGAASLGQAAGPVDLCTFPVTVALQRWRLAKMSCLLEIALDVGRSLGASPLGISFEPHYRVLFQETP